MSNPENHTLRLLRDIRGAILSLDQKVNRNHEELKSHIGNLARVVAGESVLGRYAPRKSRNGSPPSRSA